MKLLRNTSPVKQIEIQLVWFNQDDKSQYWVNVDSKSSDRLLSDEELLRLLEDLRHLETPLKKGDKLITRRTGREMLITIRGYAYPIHGSSNIYWWYGFQLRQGEVTEEVNVNFLEGTDSW